MYIAHLKPKETSGKGLGIVTEIAIPTRTPIMEVTGNFFTKEQSNEDYLQIGPNLFIGPSGKVDDYLNHACFPNCYLSIIGKRAILYSLYPIKANNELTIDYSLSSNLTPSEWSMTCNCKHFNCRKSISGFNSLPEAKQTEYKTKGIVPLFILRPNLFLDFKGDK